MNIDISKGRLCWAIAAAALLFLNAARAANAPGLSSAKASITTEAPVRAAGVQINLVKSGERRYPRSGHAINALALDEWMGGAE
jgi:hypothetical protein